MQQLSERYSLPLKTSYNTARGFFIQLYVGGGEGGGAGHTSLENLPSEFIKLSKQKSTLSFVTADLASVVSHNLTCYPYLHCTVIASSECGRLQRYSVVPVVCRVCERLYRNTAVAVTV